MSKSGVMKVSVFFSYNRSQEIIQLSFRWKKILLEMLMLRDGFFLMFIAWI